MFTIANVVIVNCSELHYAWFDSGQAPSISQPQIQTRLYLSLPLPHFKYRIGKDFEDDLEFLLKGVSEFDLQGGSIASEVLVHGPLAFPIGTTGDGRAFLAGAYYGQGRVIVVTHEGFLGREVEFIIKTGLRISVFLSLLENIIRFCSYGFIPRR